MGCRVFSKFPYIMKPICFVLLILLLVLLWFNRQFPSTKLTTWQILPSVFFIVLIACSGPLVHDPEWAYLEMIACLLFSSASLANTYFISQLQMVDTVSIAAFSLSIGISILWIFQLIAFSLAAVWDFCDTKTDSHDTSQGEQKLVRTSSASLNDYPSENEDEIYHGFHLSVDDQK